MSGNNPTSSNSVNTGNQGSLAASSALGSSQGSGGMDQGAMDNRSNQMNPNNQAALDNRANQMNPNNAATKGKR